MKEVKKAAAQGDVIIIKRDGVPAGFVEKERKGEIIIVSHSETGHHHVIRESGVRLFEAPADMKTTGLVSFLMLGEGCDSFVVEHLRDYDTHEALRFSGVPGDVFEVRRQREHTPEGWRRVQD